MFSAVRYDNKYDWDKNIPKKEDMDKNILKKEGMDKNIPKKDKDKTMSKTNKYIQVFRHKNSKRNKENGDWKIKRIVWVFWNNK